MKIKKIKNMQGDIVKTEGKMQEMEEIEKKRGTCQGILPPPKQYRESVAPVLRKARIQSHTTFTDRLLEHIVSGVIQPPLEQLAQGLLLLLDVQHARLGARAPRMSPSNLLPPLSNRPKPGLYRRKQ